MSFLRGSVGGEVRVADSVADGLLGASDGGVGGVGDLLSDVGHGCYVVVVICFLCDMLKDGRSKEPPLLYRRTPSCRHINARSLNDVIMLS